MIEGLRVCGADAWDVVSSVCDLEEQYYRQHERISDVRSRHVLLCRSPVCPLTSAARIHAHAQMESIYLDMQTQRLRVSPRAIEQGWVEEMEEKMQRQRAAITALKLETIFTLGLELKQKETQLLEYQRRIRELEEKRARFAIWREEEFLDYWEVRLDAVASVSVLDGSLSHT